MYDPSVYNKLITLTFIHLRDLPIQLCPVSVIRLLMLKDGYLEFNSSLIRLLSVENKMTVNVKTGLMANPQEQIMTETALLSGNCIQTLWSPNSHTPAEW